jgi:hypothetical protein
MSVTFTESATRRIAAAVRKVERSPQDLRGDRTTEYDTETEFWAILLGGDMAGRYTFQPVRPDPSGLAIDGVIIVSDRGDELRWAFTDSPAFVGAAREANANISVPTFKVVRMSFAGYDAGGSPVFVFFYPPANTDAPGLPPHDHRDNFNGGFSFSTFHPGSSVPQMPWAL